MILSKVYEDAERRLERNEITLGEFERLVDIEVIEPKRGEWIDKSRILYNDWGHYYYRECSLCGYKREDDNPDNDTNFCPNCGADMRGDKE